MRLNFRRAEMPHNVKGRAIDPSPYRALDGFSPGSVVLERAPGLQTPAALERTDPVGLTDVSRYARATAPVLLFDARTRERWPIWVELDSNATKGSQRLLEIHPATNLLEGHRYVVVLRNLRRDFTTAQNPNIARRVTGTITVPCYLDRPGCPPGSSFHYARKGDFLPSQIAGNVATAAFTCVLPRAATPATPARVSLYGHGLLGSHDEVSDSNVQLMAVEHDFVFCATDWAGLASEDIPNAISILQDFSGMKTLADRQGFVNQLYLGRLLVHPQGFAANPAFQQGGVPIVDPGHLYYDATARAASSEAR